MRDTEQRHGPGHDSFALRLRAARERAGMSPERLAEAGGITLRRLTSLEMGGSTPLDPHHINGLAHVLQVEALWLMAGDLAGERFRPAWYAPGARA
jgi:transcriptional regulator with XRE-family HTH domain